MRATNPDGFAMRVTFIEISSECLGLRTPPRLTIAASLNDLH